MATFFFDGDLHYCWSPPPTKSRRTLWARVAPGFYPLRADVPKNQTGQESGDGHKNWLFSFI